MTTPQIWLVGINPQVASALSDEVHSEEYVIEQVQEMPSEFLCGDSKPAAVVLSVIDSGSPGLKALGPARRAVPPVPVVVLVPSDQAGIAVEAMKMGAADAILAPVDPAEVLEAVRNVEQKTESNGNGKAKHVQEPPIESAIFLSKDPKMREIWSVASTVARTDVPVLILGESGVGKEILARFIHRRSTRAEKPLIKVNCAAIPHDLLESELFGYERGAFTGAVGEKPGKFELADKGCIVLDEIGEMPPSLQAKLLHVLEDGEFSRLGGKRPVRVDVRVLALTNRRLHEAIPRGEFRDDLYFRLSVVKVRIPPLRERKDDIPVLCDFFLRRHRNGMPGPVELPAELLAAFMQYDWPGNVRQLENMIRRYLIFPQRHMELDVIDSCPRPSAEPSQPTPVAAPVERQRTVSTAPHLPGPNESVSLKKISSMAVEGVEREMVLHILDQTNWNRRHAARRLSISYRALLNKLKKWQIRQPRLY